MLGLGTPSDRLAAVTLAAATLMVVAAATQPAAGQGTGLTYDMSTSGTMPGRGGAPVTRTFMAGHGQFADGNARIDYVSTDAPTGAPAGASAGGFMSPGTYVVVKGATRTSYFVDPAKHEYMEFNSDSMSKMAAKMQGSLGGMVKTEMSDISVSGENLGTGEPIDGYATVKYRVTDANTMTVSVMGRTSRTQSKAVTDLWIAPQLDANMNPMARSSAGSGTAATAAYTDALQQAYAKMPKGVPVKTVMHRESIDGGKTQSVDITMTLSNIKRGPVSASVFEIPAGYTKNDMFNQMGAIGAALGDSLAKARTAAGAPGTSGPSASAPASGPPSLPGAAAGAAKDGATEGVTEQAKDEAKTKAKSALHGLLHP
jgi:uncharacterized protein DUF4412